MSTNHWIASFVNGDNGSLFYDATYFDSFGAEHIPKEIKKLIGNKNIIANICRIQVYYSIMCRYLLLYWIYWF